MFNNLSILKTISNLMLRFVQMFVFSTTKKVMKKKKYISNFSNLHLNIKWWKVRINFRFISKNIYFPLLSWITRKRIAILIISIRSDEKEKTLHNWHDNKFNYLIFLALCWYNYVICLYNVYYEFRIKITYSTRIQI